jgi:hypothetical protein
LQEAATIATPDTILRWYRELVAANYDGTKNRGPGRPKKAAEIVRLLLEMATRNTTWGYTRLRDALSNVGYDIPRTTVQRILAEHGIEPAPQREREYSSATFIKAHLGAIAGMDFFTVEVLTVVGLVRYHGAWGRAYADGRPDGRSPLFSGVITIEVLPLPNADQTGSQLLVSGNRTTGNYDDWMVETRDWCPPVFRSRLPVRALDLALFVGVCGGTGILMP